VLRRGERRHTVQSLPLPQGVLRYLTCLGQTAVGSDGPDGNCRFVIAATTAIHVLPTRMSKDVDAGLCRRTPELLRLVTEAEFHANLEVTDVTVHDVAFDLCHFEPLKIAQ
jgi:hypothetical protein